MGTRDIDTAPDLTPRAEAGESRPPGVTRVLFVISQLGLGGTEKNMVELVLRLDRDTVQPMVLVFAGGCEREGLLRKAGIPVRVVDRRWGRFADRLRAIHAVVGEFRPHVLQAFDNISGIYCAVAGRLAAVPTVLSCMMASYMPARIRYPHRLVQRWLDGVVCNAARGRQYLVEECGYPPERTILIPNGLDFKAMEEDPGTSLREELGLTASSPLVGLVGKLNRDKDPLTFARAAAWVHRQRQDVRFCLIGSGPLHTEVRGYLEGVGLADRFFLVPARPDAAWLVREFDIAALSSATEGLPTVLTEYMYWSRPVVTTDAGDCATVVLDGETGLVVPRGDWLAFGNALLRLLSDPAMAGRLGRAGRGRLKERYRIERYVTDFVSLYARLRIRDGVRPTRGRIFGRQPGSES